MICRHENVNCPKKCNQTLECGHPCRYLCHPKKPDNHCECLEWIEKPISECGHRIRIECSKIPTMNMCKKETIKQLLCGHSLTVPCKTVASDRQLKQFVCSIPCQQILACGHPCAGKCGECQAGRLHVACKQKCERELICSHVSSSLLGKKPEGEIRIFVVLGMSNTLCR